MQIEMACPDDAQISALGPNIISYESCQKEFQISAMIYLNKSNKCHDIYELFVAIFSCNESHNKPPISVFHISARGVELFPGALSWLGWAVSSSQAKEVAQQDGEPVQSKVKQFPKMATPSRRTLVEQLCTVLCRCRHHLMRSHNAIFAGLIAQSSVGMEVGSAKSARLCEAPFQNLICPFIPITSVQPVYLSWGVVADRHRSVAATPGKAS